MKKIGAGLAALGILLVIAVGCNSSSDEDAKSTGGAQSTTQVTDDTFRAVRVGMTEQEVLDLCGDPTRHLKQPDAQYAGWIYVYGGGKETMVSFDDGKVAFLPWIDGKPQ